MTVSPPPPPPPVSVHAVHFHVTSNLAFSPPSQGSDADKSDDNLVVDEVSRRPPAPGGLSSERTSAQIE